jgi:hypothetical protein
MQAALAAHSASQGRHINWRAARSETLPNIKPTHNVPTCKTVVLQSGTLLREGRGIQAGLFTSISKQFAQQHWGIKHALTEMTTIE